MKVRAVIFDLDETLIEEETSNDASALAAGEIATIRHGVDRVALLTALRKHSRELFLAGPLIDYCRDIGISACVGLTPPPRASASPETATLLRRCHPGGKDNDG